MRRLLSCTLLVLPILAHPLQAAISVTALGAGPFGFESTPAVTEFSTGVFLGNRETFLTEAQLDAAVATVHALNIVRPLPTSATVPPSIFAGGFRHNSAGLYLQSRPATDGTNAANVLLATLRNDTGDPIGAFQVSYDFNVFNPRSGELPGFRVYFSLEGTPESWQLIPEMSGLESPGRVSAMVTPAGPWFAGREAYLLWADDNNSSTDPSYTIDNLAVGGPIAETFPPIITRQPESQAVTFGGWVRLFVEVAGNTPFTYQWRHDGTAVSAASDAEFVLSGAQTVDKGGYDVVVRNDYGATTSQVATLIVTSIVYRLTVSGGGGSVLPASSSYHPGAQVTLVAKPDPGWRFLQWLGSASGTNATNTVAMTRDRCVTAVFGTRFSATTPSCCGYVAVEQNSAWYPYGAVVRVTAEPSTGYYFTGWSQAGSGTTNPLCFVITNPLPNVVASFAWLDAGDFALTARAEGFGAVNISPAGNHFPSGTPVQLTAVPDPGQQFLGWSNDVSGTPNPLVVPMDRQKLITARFSKRPSLQVQPCSEPSLEDGFQFLITGGFGARYEVENTDGLQGWSLVGTVTNTFGKIQFNDATATNAARRIYRAVLAP